MAEKKLNPGSWIEIAVRSFETGPSVKRIARNFFVRAGIDSSRITCTSAPEFFATCVYTRSLSEAKALRKAFSAFNRGAHGLRFSRRILKRGDWLDKWKNSYRAGPLGARFFLVPLRRKKPRLPRGRIPVFLDPRSAFGTGTHETTRLMIRLMEGVKGRFGDFMDIGTGTGILSVVAFQLGAGRILGIDRERNSVRTARFNLVKNRCRPAKLFVKEISGFCRKERFDLVGANLLSETLISNKKKIISLVRPGKYLALSGIARKHLRAFRGEFRDCRLKCLKMMKGRKWGAVLYQRKKTI
ncbi:MAG TPA: 50S ribosomal protein L11 methyltransferase [Candidatus Omnitrophota bacterium]|nr:50S ribosomal protein L11 methyltransferase [Candidatus Omnitrophota bacterium]